MPPHASSSCTPSYIVTHVVVALLTASFLAFSRFGFMEKNAFPSSSFPVVAGNEGASTAPSLPASKGATQCHCPPSSEGSNIQKTKTMMTSETESSPGFPKKKEGTKRGSDSEGRLIAAKGGSEGVTNNNSNTGSKSNKEDASTRQSTQSLSWREKGKLTVPNAFEEFVLSQLQQQKNITSTCMFPSFEGFEKLYLLQLNRACTLVPNAKCVQPPAKIISRMYFTELARLLSRSTRFSRVPVPLCVGGACGGSVWPLIGETYSSLSALAIWRRLLTSIHRKNIQGAILDLGAWRGGSAIFTRYVLGSVEDTRAVYLADPSYNDDPSESCPPPFQQQQQQQNPNETKDSSQSHCTSPEEVIRHFEEYCTATTRIYFLAAVPPSKVRKVSSNTLFLESKQRVNKGSPVHRGKNYASLYYSSVIGKNSDVFVNQVAPLAAVRVGSSVLRALPKDVLSRLLRAVYDKMVQGGVMLIEEYATNTLDEAKVPAGMGASAGKRSTKHAPESSGLPPKQQQKGKEKDEDTSGKSDTHPLVHGGRSGSIEAVRAAVAELASLEKVKVLDGHATLSKRRDA